MCFFPLTAVSLTTWTLGYTNLWRIAQVRTGRYHLNIKKLHEKYGPIVRIGPNLLDLDYPEMNRVIYSTDGKWTKTEFYKNNSAMVNGVQTFTIFSELDQGQHARMKRPLAKFISLGHVLALEPHMDSVVNELIGYIDTRFVKPKKTCNLGEWIAFYAWDLIGSVTFSKQMGYMEAEKDFDHTLAIADKALDYFAVVGQMPWLDYWLDKNPVVRVGPPNLTNVMRIALESLIARLQGKDANYGPKAPDYLQHYIGTKETHPDLVDDGMIIGFLLVNLLAGVDTTAITIRALFDFVLRRPDVYRKLVKEIRGARFDVDKSAPYSAARRLRTMNAADLPFGGGSRICLGRNLALVEVYKIVATLLNRYEIELEDPKRELHVINSCFMRQEGLITKITPRK